MNIFEEINKHFQAAAPKVKKELTNYEQFQMERYGNVLAPIESTPEGELFESGIDELNRWAEYMEMQAERQMHEYEKD